jgi:HD superfamily phosphohydrolase
MSERRRVRDPVHGFIELAGDEIDIVATPIFQHLRGIRQLAFANLVYPGALHTRFDHTLGVFHVSSLLCEVFNFAEDDKKLVRLAALLHDLGHGPFSHVSEEALEIFADREKLNDRIKDGYTAKIHELVTRDILRTDPDLARHIAPATLERIEALLANGYGEPVLRDVVSGPLDADKQDYLLRDSYFCGVKYGIFDLQQLHRELRVIQDVDGKRLMITMHGVNALEQFVLAKHYLTAQVYKHRLRLIMDQMVVRAIVLGIAKDGIEDLKKLYSYDGNPEFVKNYCAWDDARFMLTFGEDRFKGSHCHAFVQRLKKRRLLKEVFESKRDELPNNCWDVIDGINKPLNRAKREGLERCISGAIESAGIKLVGDGFDPTHFVIANVYKPKALKALSRNDEGPILVEKLPNPTTFEEESDVFRSLSNETIESKFAVYAPVEYDNPKQRRDLRASVRDPILKCLEEFGNG